MNNRLVSFIGELYDHTIGSVIVRGADQSVGVSMAAGEFLRHLGAEDPLIIYNGIESSDICTPRGHGQNNLIRIAYIGRLIYAKGVQDLLQAVSLLQQDIHLDIVGDGPYRQNLERLAGEMQGNQISFLGYKNDDEVRSILTNTDIFINPSYSEGLPVSVMEACAAGCPVIATDVGGTNEIIKDGLNGYLIAPGIAEEIRDKIQLLINAPETRERMGSISRTMISEKFSWNTILEDWHHIISSMCNTLEHTE